MSTSLILKGKPAGAGTTPNRFVKFVFNHALAEMEFAVRVGASTQDIVFRGDVDAETLQGLLEGCDDLTGYGVDVFGGTEESGTSDDGAALHSGAFIVVLHGIAPYPAWGNVQNAEVQSLVAGGGGGGYTLNGGASFTAAITQEDLQANQRALGGDYVNVVTRGNFALSWAVGALTAHSSSNGNYSRVPDVFSGKLVASLNGQLPLTDGVWRLYWHEETACWCLSNGYNPGNNLGAFYWISSSADTPPESGWSSYTGTPPTITPNHAMNVSLYFPYNTGNVATPTATGMNAVASTLYEHGSASTLVTSGSADIESLLIAGLQYPANTAPVTNFTPQAEHWYSPLPATQQEAADRIAAAFYNWWLYPIPNQT